MSKNIEINNSRIEKNNKSSDKKIRVLANQQEKANEKLLAFVEEAKKVIKETKNKNIIKVDELLDKKNELIEKLSELSKESKSIVDNQKKSKAIEKKSKRIVKKLKSMDNQSQLKITFDKKRKSWKDVKWDKKKKNLIEKSTKFNKKSIELNKESKKNVHNLKKSEILVKKSGILAIKSNFLIEKSKYKLNWKQKIQISRDNWNNRPEKNITKWSILRNNLIKWSAIVIILVTISFLTLTYLKSTGFSFFDKWTDSSQATDTIPGLPVAPPVYGAGALQKSTMQIIITFMGGGALGLAGALLQKITKNRLAEVSILGIGSLNILFIYIYAMSLKDKAFGSGIWGVMMPVFLIIVSIIGTLFVWAVSRSRKANKNTFVIVGIALQLLVEALSVIVVNPTKLNNSTSTGGGLSEGKQIWNKIKGYTLGDVRNAIGNDKANPVEWWLIWLVIGIVFTVIAIIFFLRRKIDAYETSEELASATGVNIKRLRLVVYLLVALLAGAASSTLGTVALLGIIAPSIARLLFKNRFWPMAVASFLIGGIMVALAAFLSLQAGWGVSVGILSTAIVIPYFLFLMVKEK